MTLFKKIQSASLRGGPKKTGEQTLVTHSEIHCSGGRFAGCAHGTDT